MYKIRVDYVNSREDEVQVQVEDNLIVFPNEEMAHEFIIELLKKTGRIGY